MKTNVILLLLAVSMIVLPLVFFSNKEFSGADGKAMDTIEDINPFYEPWFTNLWEPNSGEVESFLFALQAAGGAAFIGYAFGFAKARFKYKEKGQLVEHDDDY
ncbi:energy-coupling factor ABC transporter substrate-binding protein [Bacillus alveayuensis]|uniref:energy-coupling factor ABC transporter substrate-binding protein n=1 Tax=Aeribacillus alveayuensis TaxID=279215 RepID=UPI000A008741|nr:energy-coupling factor ABC transporter substrate-binding protein [Bacillus alveayuensis]